jgi:ADP-heptose:LPS heptosyltransferase
VRYGARGDALWASSVLPALKAQGYHVTVYTQETGEEVLRHDPHVDRIIVHSEYLTPATEFVAYWEHERPKYERWINLIQAVEARLLPAPHDMPFHWPDALRRRRMNENYLEAVHEFAGVPYALRAQKFYPTTAELAWAFDKRTELRGPVVVLNPSGSTWPKWWPHAERFAALMAEQGVHCVVLGDWRGKTPALDPRFGHFVGCDWTIRQAMAFASLAAAVVGVESAIVNAVAFESPLKIVLLSHSSGDNLTRDWLNTISMWPLDLACYPCHRLHGDATYCTRESATDSAACQAAVSAERVADHVVRYLGLHERVAA